MVNTLQLSSSIYGQVDSFFSSFMGYLFLIPFGSMPFRECCSSLHIIGDSIQIWDVLLRLLSNGLIVHIYLFFGDRERYYNKREGIAE